MHKLGGWHRLWVVTCVVLFLIVGLLSALLFPNLSTVGHRDEFYSKLSADAKVQLAPEGSDNASRVRMPNGHVVLVREGIELKKSIPLLAEYERKLHAALREERTEFLVAAFLWWFVPCVALYCCGSAMGWVARGFKSREQSP